MRPEASARRWAAGTVQAVPRGRRDCERPHRITCGAPLAHEWGIGLRECRTWRSRATVAHRRPLRHHRWQAHGRRPADVRFIRPACRPRERHRGRHPAARGCRSAWGRSWRSAWHGDRVRECVTNRRSGGRIRPAGRCWLQLGERCVQARWTRYSEHEGCRRHTPRHGGRHWRKGLHCGRRGPCAWPAGLKDSREENEDEGTQRPDYLVEDRETWEAGRRGVAPPVIE